MRRRSVLAGIAVLGAGSGCTRVVTDNPVDVRVMRASEDDVERADDQCRLPESLLDAHHVLDRTLDSAATAPVGEWVTADADRETGESLAGDLRDHCEQSGGIYRYDGEHYRIRVVDAESGDRLREGHTLLPDGHTALDLARAAEFGSD